jgi:chromosome segregation ATPase
MVDSPVAVRQPSQPPPADSSTDAPNAALAAVHAATRAFHAVDGYSHTAFDQLLEATREMLLGLQFHALDDTARAHLHELTARLSEAKDARDEAAARVAELRRRIGIADDDAAALDGIATKLAAIECHAATLDRIRAAVEDKAAYRGFLDSFGGRVVAVQNEWKRRLADVDDAVEAARTVLKREYDAAQSQWTEVERKVMKS